MHSHLPSFTILSPPHPVAPTSVNCSHSPCLFLSNPLFHCHVSCPPPPSLISISRECCQPFSSLLASVISLFSLFHPVANVFAPVNLASQKIKSNCFKCVFRLPELSQTFLVNILIEQTFMRSGIIYQLFVLC